jgi:hypothetical protein
MPDLETRLRALSPDELFPPTPDIAGAVATRLRAAPAPAPRRRLSRRTLAIALAALLLLPAAAVAAIPSTRNAVLDWLGLRHVEVRRSTTQPRLRQPTISDLGERVSLAGARARVDFAVLVPEALGDPTSVYVRESPPGGRVVLVFDRIQVTELQGKSSRQFVEKMLGPDAKIERVRVDGAPGLWISGKPHGVMYADRNGQLRDETFQLAGDTLVWERGGLVLRIEGARSKADALRIASSIAVSG